jgi:hypothetical protein
MHCVRVRYPQTTGTHHWRNTCSKETLPPSAPHRSAMRRSTKWNSAAGASSCTRARPSSDPHKERLPLRAQARINRRALTHLPLVMHHRGEHNACDEYGHPHFNAPHLHNGRSERAYGRSIYFTSTAMIGAGAPFATAWALKASFQRWRACHADPARTPSGSRWRARVGASAIALGIPWARYDLRPALASGPHLQRGASFSTAKPVGISFRTV